MQGVQILSLVRDVLHAAAKKIKEESCVILLLSKVLCFDDEN